MGNWRRRALLLGALTLAGGGCTATRVASQHPLIVAGAGGPTATVYFIRPDPERAMGYSDNPVDIDLNQEPLLKLARGEYTVLSLIPRDAIFTLRNQTEAGGNWNVKELERQYRFSFAPGGTYYLVVKPVDGEFRGVHFRAENVDANTARQVAAQLHAAGAARQQPLGPPAN
jgi:hypothetical protein